MNVFAHFLQQTILLPFHVSNVVKPNHYYHIKVRGIVSKQNKADDLNQNNLIWLIGLMVCRCKTHDRHALWQLRLDPKFICFSQRLKLHTI